MNGVYENAVINALRSHKNISKIILCTDNDEGGIDAADRLTDVLRELGYTDISRNFPTYKDWNEDLKARSGAAPLQAVPHKRKNIYAEIIADLQYFKCDAVRLCNKLSKIYNERQYRYLAEYALAASAFFIDKNNEKAMFEKLKIKLSDGYRAYSDKGKICSKQADLRSVYIAVIRDLKHDRARTKEQSVQTSKQLFELADRVVRCEAEQQINIPEIEETEEPRYENLFS